MHCSEVDETATGSANFWSNPLGSAAHAEAADQEDRLDASGGKALPRMEAIEVVLCFLDRCLRLLEFALCLRPVASGLPLLCCRRCQHPLGLL